MPTQLDPGQVIKGAYDEPDQAIRVNIVAGSVVVTNPSVGVNGATAPTSSNEAGAIDPSGNLQGLKVDASGNLLVDGSSVTQPVSAISLPLPTGAATSANQTTANTSLSDIDTKVTSIDNKTPALGQALAAGSTPVVLTAAQLSTLTPLTSVTVTQATGTNLHTVVDSGTVAATQSGNWSVRNQDGSGNAITSTASALDVNIKSSGVTQPVSGTVTVVQPTGTNLHTVIDSGTTTVTQATGTNLHTVVDSGTITANIGTTNGLALDTTLAKLNNTQGSTTSGETGPLIQGAVTTSAPSYTTGQTNPLSLTTGGALRVDASASTQPISGTVTANQGTANATPWNENISQINGITPLMGNGVTGTGSQRVTIASDNTPFTVNAAQSGTWNITNVSGTVSLPTGASTSALQTTGNTSLSTIATNTTNLNLTIGATGAAIPADAILLGVKNGSNMVAITQGSATSANSIPVVIASDQAAVTVKQQVGGSATLSNVASSASNVNLLASNANRTGAAFFNDSTSTVYLKLGSTASTTSYTVQILAGGYYEIPFFNKMYSGAIDAIWASANGNMRITEFT